MKVLILLAIYISVTFASTCHKVLEWQDIAVISSASVFKTAILYGEICNQTAINAIPNEIEPSTRACLFVCEMEYSVSESTIQKLEESNDSQITLEWVAIILMSFTAFMVTGVICWIIHLIQKTKQNRSTFASQTIV